MEVKVISQKIIYLHFKKAWSQQHLSGVLSVSLRAVQRIEEAGVASQESVNSIASVLSIRQGGINMLG